MKRFFLPIFLILYATFGIITSQNIKSVFTNLPDGFVTSTKLAENSITTDKIADGAVTDIKKEYGGYQYAEVLSLDPTITPITEQVIPDRVGVILDFRVSYSGSTVRETYWLASGPTYNEWIQVDTTPDNYTLYMSANRISIKDAGVSTDKIADDAVTNDKLGNRGTAAPTTGTYNLGDFITNSVPSLGERAGWMCVYSGTPGTWQGFGQVGYRQEKEADLTVITPKFKGELIFTDEGDVFIGMSTTLGDWKQITN